MVEGSREQAKQVTLKCALWQGPKAIQTQSLAKGSSSAVGEREDADAHLTLQLQPRRLRPLRTRLRWRQPRPSQAPAPAAPQNGCAARAAPHGRPPGRARWPRPLSWPALAHARLPSCRGWLLHQIEIRNLSNKSQSYNEVVQKSCNCTIRCTW